jgi:hypothetical protein
VLVFELSAPIIRSDGTGEKYRRMVGVVSEELFTAAPVGLFCCCNERRLFFILTRLCFPATIGDGDGPPLK